MKTIFLCFMLSISTYCTDRKMYEYKVNKLPEHSEGTLYSVMNYNVGDTAHLNNIDFIILSKIN